MDGGDGKPALLFVHGAFAAAWMWADTFLPWFAQAGYPCYALSLRGHGKSSDQERIDWLSIADYVEDVRVVADWLDTTPVLVGHSMGGFVVQKYLEAYPAQAAVLLCSVPPQGLAASQFHMLFQKPGLFLELNHVMNGRMVSLDAVRESLFAQPVSQELLTGFRDHMQVESQRAIWDMTMFHLPTLPFGDYPPLFIVGAEHDVMVPPFMVLATAHTYGAQAHICAGMGHAITHEQDWRDVATMIARWLEARPELQTVVASGDQVDVLA
jgi:non-heme chloroperoxidase